MSLPVFSLFPYSKKGESEAIETASRIVEFVKKGRIGFLNEYFDQKISPADKQLLSDFIPPNATLIPLPKSAPLLENAVWPGRDICEMLLSKGWGGEYLPLIKRKTAVPKAAFQPNAEERPTVELHINSMELDESTVFSQHIQEIVLVDDVVTQGRTAYAAFVKLQSKFPGIPVKLFTLVRSDSFHKINHWSEPAKSEIIFYPGSGKTFHNMDPNPPVGLWG